MLTIIFDFQIHPTGSRRYKSSAVYLDPVDNSHIQINTRRRFHGVLTDLLFATKISFVIRDKEHQSSGCARLGVEHRFTSVLVPSERQFKKCETGDG